MDFESEINALGDADKAHIAPHYTRYVQLGEDAQSAIAELDRITDQFGTSRAAMPTGQAQRHENFSRRAVRLAEDLQAAEADLIKRIDGAKRAHALAGQVGTSRSGGFAAPDVFVRSHGNPWAGLENGDSATGLRSRATDMLGVIADVPEASRNAFADSLDNERADNGLMARWALATGRDAYRRAFAKLLSDPQRGHLLFSDDEAHAYREAEYVGRAMAVGGDGTTGGFLVPFYLDPSVILTGNGSISAIRGLARQVSTAGVKWHGVSSAGATAEWIAEAAEVADASPTLAQPAIDLYKFDAFVPYSFELETSQPELGSDLQALLSDAADQLTSTAFVSGNGTTAAGGLLTGLTSSQKVDSGTAHVFTPGVDVVALQNALPPRFQPGAEFLANLATVNAIASAETTNGALRFPEVANGQLLRRPLHEESNITGTVADGAKVLVYGDINKAYTIVNGVGTRVEIVQHLFGDNGRPTGQRGLLLWARVGAGVVAPNAARYLSIKAS